MTTDLFGQVPEGNPPPHRQRAGSRAYPAPPGTGPEGETCRGCAHYCSTKTRAGSTFPKCGKMEPNWSSGRATDIKARSPACRYFERRAPDAPFRGVLKG
jgi:hypothetical protein